MSNTQCCRGQDVRGMCFTCIGDLSKMTADTILKVRNCPGRDYAIAYWIHNNHGCEKYYEKRGIWADEFQKNEYLALLNPNWGWVDEAIYEIEHDDDDDEEDE